MENVWILASLWVGLALYGGRVSELEAKYLLFFRRDGRFGSLVWQRGCATCVHHRHGISRYCGERSRSGSKLRTLTFGLLTPFYFIRAGSFMSVPALFGSPLVFVALLFAKMFSKIIGLLPTVKAFKYERNEGLYYTLMMSTGLTCGTISALFGLNHGIIDQRNIHSWATVIGSAVIPTMIANAFFMPRHLLRRREREPITVGISEQPGSTD